MEKMLVDHGLPSVLLLIGRSGVLLISFTSRLVLLTLCSTLMQLVFVVFTGEAWGFLGSRRFLHELGQHDDGIDGLNLSMVEVVSYPLKPISFV